MSDRDKDKTFEREAILVTDPITIKRIREDVQQADDEVCRKFARASPVQALIRILNHQSLPESFFADRTQFAAAEVWNARTASAVVSCESQVLTTSGDDRIYSNLYYLKFGTVRAGKQLVVKIETRWKDPGSRR